MRLGERIAQKRKEHGWTQAELARRMGLSEAYGHTQVSSWENGLGGMSVPSARRAAMELGVSLDWLLTGEGSS